MKYSDAVKVRPQFATWEKLTPPKVITKPLPSFVPDAVAVTVTCKTSDSLKFANETDRTFWFDVVSAITDVALLYALNVVQSTNHDKKSRTMRLFFMNRTTSCGQSHRQKKKITA